MFGKNIQVRVIITAVVLLLAIFFLIPSLTDNLPEFWKKNLPTDKLHLGLDLQGGMHLVLEVQAAKAVESSVERLTNDLKDLLMTKRVRFRELERTGDNAIRITLADKDAVNMFLKVIDEQYPYLETKSSESSGEMETYHLAINQKQVETIEKSAIEQSLETIRNRIDQFGVSEPEIIPEGKDRIVVQLPGVRDPQRAINLIGKTALLEFKMVDDEHNLDEALRGNIPTGDIVLYGDKVDNQTGAKRKIPYLLKEKTLLTGQSLENAKVAISNRFGEAYVAIKFDAQGARDFDRITGENVKKRLAIVLDGVVHSAPVIQERISGGNAQITGSFTTEEARDLAIVLRAGALPAPVLILEQRTVGPSLGQDSIEKGFLSMIIGSILVFGFMVVYYKYSGIVADCALILNVILLMGALAAFKATLTLPGIAGIVLTTGMAVDANVLIYERIREELRLGKSTRAAIEAGYGRAFLTIIDTHVTNLIGAAVLFQFGTGAVKGFAVTLTLGIIISLFTTVFATRIVFDYFIWYRKITSVSV
ncbi:MAG: protein translocase subunit SecD [Deltaproteobacteria bacterium]|nr:protein translocase subunit SecD [Deltaproteobacteria bacterium]